MFSRRWARRRFASAKVRDIGATPTRWLNSRATGPRFQNFDSLFVDLNRDDVSAVVGFADRGEIYLPNTALRADLIVSLAKMKTHHWAGATLSMKNFFGLVPGSRVWLAEK